MLNNIYNNVSKLEQIIKDREIKINLLKKFKLPLVSKLPIGRLINCWPYPYSGNEDFFKNSGCKLLHFNNTNREKKIDSTKVIAIPLHKDISKDQINIIIKKHISNQKSKKNEI